MFFEWWRWQAGRETGNAEWPSTAKRYPVPVTTPVTKLYPAIAVLHSWNPATTADHQHHGAVFGSDFSPDGTLLVAACENRSVLMFDPLNGKLVQHCNMAHMESVNCVRFLDHRTFATCSDDTTVKLWDARFLKKSMRVLRGHANWVKNIEYAPEHGALVTSGFDGAIYRWNINEYTEEGRTNYTQLFKMDGLMRAILTPDCGKLVISSMGYLMVVHNLDLDHIQGDLRGFKPNLYRLVQAGEQPHIRVDHFNPMFERSRNRVELISDFPSQDEADMISSLQVHPQGWCVASRNVASDENSEWTCVHDIQERDSVEDAENKKSSQDDNYGKNAESSAVAATSAESTLQGTPVRQESPSDHTDDSPVTSDTDTSFTCDTGSHESSGSNESSESDGQSNPDSPNVRWVRVSVTDPADLEGLQAGNSDTTGDASVSEADPEVSVANEPSRVMSSFLRPAQILMYLIQSGSPSVSARTVMFSGIVDQRTRPSGSNLSLNKKIHKNTPHLTHYIQEPNVGSGYIKEMCFSKDGRLICSPFAFGVRLLGFDPDCREVCDCVPHKPKQLFEVGCNISHSNHVMTVDFSPTHCLFISGCLNGKVDFHQPRI